MYEADKDIKEGRVQVAEDIETLIRWLNENDDYCLCGQCGDFRCYCNPPVEPGYSRMLAEAARENKWPRITHRGRRG